MEKKTPKTFIISRTDSIGDVVLTLPMAGVLKKKYPESFIYFLGQKYTQPIIECCKNIDQFLDWTHLQTLPIDEQISFLHELSTDQIIHVFPVKKIAKLSKSAKIPLRIGTRNRWFHWFYCNKLVKLSRKNSNLHESQLNMKLLVDFNVGELPSLREIPSFYGLTNVPPLSPDLQEYILKDKINIILHPKSKGSAREWGLKNYADLIEALPKEKYNILLTGTEAEGELFRKELAIPYPFVTDLSGKLSLNELISIINSVNALVACSTGPLHIAAALNKVAIGIYPPIKPMHPGRWAPIGGKAYVLVAEKECEGCRKSMDCTCIRSIKPEQVINILSSNFNQ